GHQPLVQRCIGRGQMLDKSAIEADQPVAVVEVGKAEPVFQGEIGHAVLIKRTIPEKPSGKSPRGGCLCVSGVRPHRSSIWWFDREKACKNLFSADNFTGSRRPSAPWRIACYPADRNGLERHQERKENFSPRRSASALSSTAF